ncbi:MAG: hypothetical protein ISR58_00300 [Anaerolineales bacterium]|nr:hypothetical protein [Chloroflexota bacterium]MBL6979603.1 hypothetical protein [Anaerolineales bacterium]
MKQSKILLLAFILIITLSLSACDREKTVCTPEAGTPKPTFQLADLVKNTSAPGPAPEPVKVEIGGKLIEVDKLVTYPTCNDDWSGTVYVSCDAQVAEWDPEEGSRFFEGCNLNIDPNAVVYVAAHNDSPHYKGCSCHTGEVYQILNP